MFISVVIPVYNVERYIENCLKALFAQDYTKDKYEVICVDNNSLDTSRDIIKRFPHVILISETNQGAYAARNLGIEKARGEIIAFTDPDCIPEINWLSKIVDAMRPVETMIVLGARYADSDSYLLSLADAYENTKKDFVFGCDTKELYFGYTNNQTGSDQIYIVPIILVKIFFA